MFNAGGSGGFLFWNTAILKYSICLKPIHEISHNMQLNKSL